MADIARRAGVTKSSVSFALNGRPGVSEGTRRRILAIAEELGWQPNTAARALSDGRAGAYGLVVDRPARTLGIEPFFMQLISGIQVELSERRVSLLLTLAEDTEAQIAVYREWWASRRVDGVFLVDVAVADPRITALEELGLPAVVIGHPVGAGSLPAVWSDDAEGVRAALVHLAALGHRAVAHVSGPRRLWHTRIRCDAFDTVTGELGLRATAVEADYSGEQGAAVTRALLRGADRPTAILYDNDVMAVAGLAAAAELGVAVPDRLSLVAWDDSTLCRLASPALTTMSVDVHQFGVVVAESVLERIDGVPVTPRWSPTARYVPRGTTAPAAG
jgi:DNA-binding LacI/PurR family transcriptional regulator